MSPTDPRRNSLQRFASRVVDHLTAARPGTLKQLVADVLAGLARRAVVDHIQLFSIRHPTEGNPRVTLSSEWSSTGVRMPRQNLEGIPLSLFSQQAARSLSHGHSVFAALSPEMTSCSRLVTAMLLETEAAGLLLVPVMLKGRFCAMLGMAHSHGPAHLDANDCRLIELIGKMIIHEARSVRRKARRRREHRQWKKVADAACDFAIVINSSHEIRRIIPYGQKLVPNVVGLRIEDFVYRQSLSDLNAAMLSSTARRQTSTCDIKADRSDGSECWYRVRIEPKPEGSTAGWFLFLTDNDAMYARQEEIRKLREHLNRASRLSLLGQISTEFAHQINQPLQAITNYCGTLQNREKRGEGSPEKTIASTEKILASVIHASQILDRIRQFVQFRELSLEPVDLRVVIERAILMTIPAANEAGVVLQSVNLLPDSQNSLIISEADTESEFVGLADHVQTTHVLVNLIVNAVEACAAARTREPKVIVAVNPHQDARHLIVSVRDNGPGLPANNPEIVFEQFHTTKPEGLGIGLAISRGVIEAQHGRLWAMNQKDRGCEFQFTVRRVDLSLSDTTEIRAIRPGDAV